ncbi:MAG: hypothetical protein KF831_10960 [Acidobacteria bacterium]|nr:hypothetical protein [Acidobacteriota bacterium]
MKHLGIFLLSVLVCANLAEAQSTRPARTAVSATAASPRPTTLPIRRVILYSNGVAYIERRGVVTGNAEVNLSFKQSQVDDVLKSMVVLDLGQGRIGAVSYNSSQPASARTAEIPFSIDSKTEDADESLSGLAGVLSQLQGAKVLVTSSKGTHTGSILTVEKRAISKMEDNERTRLPSQHTLVIASESGEISSFELSDVRSIKLLEEGTRRNINEFANATASTRLRDAKTISIASTGGGTREMMVSYVVSAPIWKTTYRVVLGDDGKPFFQGWAIVDNVSDESWDNVQLSLVSGSPVSFIQNLQKPLYRYRPIVPIPDDLNLDPQIYDAEELGSGVGYGSGSGGGSGSGSGRGTGDVNVSGSRTTSNFMSLLPGAQTSLSDALQAGTSGVETAATGRELGDLFEYRIEAPVSVERNRSALIPIVQTKMEGERVSIYNESARKDRPMGGMMLSNTTPLTFEGGSLTVLDGDAYAGEALMERLKPKERRLISFALDLGTRVSTKSETDLRPVQLIKVVNGVFQAHYFRHDKKTYTLSNQTDKVKTVYIEHPVRENWGLAESSIKPETVTDRYYRFRVVLEPFATAVVPVVEQLGQMDSYQLASFSQQQLDLFISRRYIDAALRQRLEKLIALRRSIDLVSQKMQLLTAEVTSITQDQARFRENIESLAKTPEAKQLITRYIAKANEQETRLEQIEAERKAAQAEKERLERELSVEIKNFEVK